VLGLHFVQRRLEIRAQVLNIERLSHNEIRSEVHGCGNGGFSIDDCENHRPAIGSAAAYAGNNFRRVLQCVAVNDECVKVASA